MGVLDLIKENSEEGPSTSKNEVQYVMDLITGAVVTREFSAGPGASTACIIEVLG